MVVDILELGLDVCLPLRPSYFSHVKQHSSQLNNGLIRDNLKIKFRLLRQSPVSSVAWLSPQVALPLTIRNYSRKP